MIKNVGPLSHDVDLYVEDRKVDFPKDISGDATYPLIFSLSLSFLYLVFFLSVLLSLAFSEVFLSLNQESSFSISHHMAVDRTCGAALLRHRRVGRNHPCPMVKLKWSVSQVRKFHIIKAIHCQFSFFYFEFSGTFHLGRIRTGLVHGIRLAQTANVKIVTKREIPVQIDGEPWMTSASVINVTFRNRVPMLKKLEEIWFWKWEERGREKKREESLHCVNGRPTSLKCTFYSFHIELPFTSHCLQNQKIYSLQQVLGDVLQKSERSK